MHFLNKIDLTNFDIKTLYESEVRGCEKAISTNQQMRNSCTDKAEIYMRCTDVLLSRYRRMSVIGGLIKWIALESKVQAYQQKI